MKIPSITQSAKAKQRIELHHSVKVGPESAARLSKELGRKVEVGEEFDLGVAAVYDPNYFRRLWDNLKIKKNIFN